MFQTFSGKEYMQIEVANCFGLDDKNWDERLAWFQENEENLENMVKQAKEPALFYSAVKAYFDSKAGKPNHHPVSLDATASGMQILAALTGCRKTAELCNVVDVGSRKDAYTVIYEETVKRAGDSAKIERKLTKMAVMTHFYSSTRIPKNVFGEGELLEIFLGTIKDMAPYADELNQAMLSLWDKEAYSYEWILPDNFHVVTKVMGTVSETIHFLNKPYEVNYRVNMPTETGRSLCANMVHSIDGYMVRELIRRCSYTPEHINYVKNVLNGLVSKETITRDRNKEMVIKLWEFYKEYKILSARILDHIDAHTIELVDKSIIKELVDSLPKKPFRIMPVHDCFRVLPNYGNDIRRQYTKLLSEIAKSDLLSLCLTGIRKKVTKVDKADPFLWKDILDSNYALS